MAVFLLLGLLAPQVFRAYTSLPETPAPYIKSEHQESGLVGLPSSH